MRPSRKQVGCCTFCGREVFEVRKRWPDNHPLAGEICQVGAPLPSARCCRLALMGGSQCAITICDRCKPTPDRLPELWTICCQSTAQEVEDERVIARGGTPNDVAREYYTEAVRKMVVDLPIAVLSIHRWEEDDEFARSTR